MEYMDNNESEKKEIEFDDIDENGKVTKVKKNIEKKDNDIKVEEKKEGMGYENIYWCENSASETCV